MKRPSFQFYPADWKANINLRRCSFAARGAWADVICSLHDSDEYGILRWPLKDIAAAIGAPIGLMKELVTKGVLKGSDSRLNEAFIYTPRSGRKDGYPVPLVPEQDGPIWYSSRMVKDEYIRTIRGESSRFGEGNEPQKPSPKRTPKPAPKGGMGAGKGDGSSTSSSSSTSVIPPTPMLPSSPSLADFDDDDWSNAMPTENAKRMSDLQSRINALHPSWKKRPHFSAKELHTLHENAKGWLAVTEEDWALLAGYMDASIPDSWRKDPRDFFQPDVRQALIGMGATSILGVADKWARECKRKGVATGLETRRTA